MELATHEEARAEFLDAAAFYEGEAYGLGARFIDEIERCAGLILERPEIGALFGRKVRRFVSPGDFPYSVIYAQRGETIFVVAFAHAKRRPGYWRKRIAR